MEEKLRSHIKNRADDLERSALSPGEGERRARIESGGYERFKEECREAFAVVAVLLIIFVAAACYVPTRRAMCVDPVVALRYE